MLTTTDKEHILSGKKLNDLHINLAQTILKQQFSDFSRPEIYSPADKEAPCQREEGADSDCTLQR